VSAFKIQIATDEPVQIGAGKKEGKSALKGGLKVTAPKKALKKQSSNV